MTPNYKPTPLLKHCMYTTALWVCLLFLSSISQANGFTSDTTRITLDTTHNQTRNAVSLNIGEHDAEKTPSVDGQGIKSYILLDDYSTYTLVPKSAGMPANINAYQFKEKSSLYSGRTLPAKMVDNNIYVRFSVQNTASTAISLYYYPGYYFRKIDIYEQVDDQWVPHIHTDASDPAIAEGFRLIQLPGNTTRHFLVQLQAIKTSVNVLQPKLVTENYVPILITLARQQGSDLTMIGYIFSGLLLLMVLYSLTNYVQNSTPELISYAIYTFCMGLLMFLKTYFYNYSHLFNYFFEGYFDFVLQSVGILFYTFFLNQFLRSKELYPLVYKVMKFGQLFIVLTLLVFSYLYFFKSNYFLEFQLENSFKYVLLAIGIFFIIYGLRVKRDPLIKYLVWGNIVLIFFSIISLMMIVLNINFKGVPSVLNQSLLYYEIGLVIELICFLAGLSYKNRKQLIERTREREKLKMENDRKEMEKQLAIIVAQQAERNRISADMHDELGSGMTAIRLLSELAKNKLKAAPLPEIDKISSSANDLLNKMNAIIWSMNSAHDTLENLIAYIRTFSLEYFEDSEIECRVDIPHIIPHFEISGEKRRNIFLCVKESLHNIVKHAKCKNVHMKITVDDLNFQITIEDNGVGIDLENIRQFGNGLGNLYKRMETIGGDYTIERIAGTRSTLQLHLVRTAGSPDSNS